MCHWNLIMVHISVVILAWKRNEVTCQTFIRDCNDPVILQHLTNGQFQLHTFCYHSCGYDLTLVPGANQGICTANGICQCNYPCDSAPPTNQFGDQCPAYATDPADTDPNSLPNCLAACANLCEGGTGRVCGEVYRNPIPPTTDSWAKICTCYCPPRACTNTAIAIIPVPKIPSLFLVKKVFKIFKLCVLLTKLAALCLLQLILLLCLFCNHHSCMTWDWWSLWEKLCALWGWLWT